MLDDFLQSRIEKTDSCWNWIGTLTYDGYGKFMRNGKQFRAHRAVYRLLRGDIPEGLCLDHLCRNRRCVNPEHLEAVSFSENVRRGLPFRAELPIPDLQSDNRKRRDRSLCNRSHEFSLINTGWTKQGRRYCKKCQNLRAANYYQKIKLLRS